MFLLGMIIGPSSSVEEESSSSSEGVHLLRWLPSWEPWRFFALVGSSVSTTTVVSTLALPLASMVNFAWVRILGPEVSGMDVKLDSRECCWLFRGDVLPLGREGWLIIGRLAPTPALLTSCDCGRGAGARVGSAGRLDCFFPLFSLKLRERPGRPTDLIGELARARSGLLEGTVLVLDERRSSPRDVVTILCADGALLVGWTKS